MQEKAILYSIENDRKIDIETDSKFLFEYQRALLLGLKEQGYLDEIQYRHAENLLKQQFKK